MGHKISREQIDPRVKDEIMSLVGDLSELETEVNSDIISAVNSLIVDRVDNIESMGKIANAVGNPLDSNDSVNGAVNKLNELLSTFKINMMNNGVTIESGDKFKALIDKIATLSDEDAIKNTRVIHGTTIGKQVRLDNGYTDIIVEVHGLPFEPICGYIKNSGLDNGYFISYEGLKICSTDSSDTLIIYEDGFRMPTDTTESGRTYTYWVIGLGEDTTLRDSLAGILGDKGVEVSPEDDMATLIGKVDSIKGGSLDIISATELPATGKENQICVITDNPVDNFLLTSKYTDKSTSSSPITIYLGNSDDVLASTRLTVNNGNLATNYYFNKICQGESRLASYYYNNNQWNTLTVANIPLFENGTFLNTTVVGDTPIRTSTSTAYITNDDVGNSTIFIGNNDYNLRGFSFANKINFSSFKKITIVAKMKYVAGTIYVGAMKQHYTSIIDLGTNVLEANSSYAVYSVSDRISSDSYTTFTFNISSWSGAYYLGIVANGGSSHLYIKDIILY